MIQLSEGTRLFIREQADNIAGYGHLSKNERSILDEILEGEETMVSYKDLPVTHEDCYDELRQAAFEEFYDGETEPEEWKEQTWQESCDGYRSYLYAHTYQGMLALAISADNPDVVRELIPHSDPKADDSWALRGAAEGGHLDAVKELLPHSDTSNWIEEHWAGIKFDMKQFIETFYERQSLNAAVPSVQSPPQTQAITPSRGRSGRL